jgi:hypothetical protein
MELDPNVYPNDYPLIDSSDFDAAFETLKDGIYEGTLGGYQEVVNIFGVDGAYYENCDMEYTFEKQSYAF